MRRGISIITLAVIGLSLGFILKNIKAGMILGLIIGLLISVVGTRSK
ncbi:MAG: hypothetical protein RIR55_557 [Bacteroidota bacterium]|jgi:hypothetical protein